jgi:hypothetical protein
MSASLVLFAQNGDAAGPLAGLLSMVLVFWVIGIALTVFWLWMLIDALVNEPTPNDKILWFLVIFFLHFIGALIYLVVRRSGRARPAT